MFGSIGLPELLVVLAIVASSLVVIWPAGRICRRAGFSPWLGVLAVVPIANVLLLFFVALAEWPAMRAARQP
jgi:hypothetical protein